MDICFLAVYLAFQVHTPPNKLWRDSSPSYKVKVARTVFPNRYKSCIKLQRIIDQTDKKFDLKMSKCEKLWVIATAAVESGFNPKKVSPKGAKSIMQTYWKYAPKGCSRRNCNLAMAGIYHAVSWLRQFPKDPCTAAAKYNAGPNGKCLHTPFSYSSNVLSVYFSLWDNEGVECILDRGC